jgi:hypothetical protein
VTAAAGRITSFDLQLVERRATIDRDSSEPFYVPWITDVIALSDL